VRIKVSRAVARTWPALIPDAQRLLDAFEYVCAGLQVEREDKLLDAVVGCRRRRLLDAIAPEAALLQNPDRAGVVHRDVGLQWSGGHLARELRERLRRDAAAPLVAALRRTCRAALRESVMPGRLLALIPVHGVTALPQPLQPPKHRPARRHLSLAHESETLAHNRTRQGDHAHASSLSRGDRGPRPHMVSFCG
jgi:hypothetical protein